MFEFQKLLGQERILREEGRGGEVRGQAKKGGEQRAHNKFAKRPSRELDHFGGHELSGRELVPATNKQ